MGLIPVILINERPLKDWQAAKKSAFDLVIGSLLLVVLSPLLTLIALAIRLDSPGPVLFRQPRLGFNNRLFIVLQISHDVPRHDGPAGRPAGYPG